MASIPPTARTAKRGGPVRSVVYGTDRLPAIPDTPFGAGEFAGVFYAPLATPAVLGAFVTIRNVLLLAG